MLKRVTLVILILFIAVVVFTFVAKNTGLVSLDLAFGTVTSSIAIVITATFVAGALFGALCMGPYILRLLNQRRVLRRSLRVAESEAVKQESIALTEAE